MQAEDLTGVQAEFFSMLQQAGVKASARWADVAAHFANDPHFTAVADADRLTLFRSYIRMLHEMNDLRLSGAEQEYVVCRRLLRTCCAVDLACPPQSCIMSTGAATGVPPSLHACRWHSGGCVQSRAGLSLCRARRAAWLLVTVCGDFCLTAAQACGGAAVVWQRPVVVQRRMAERVTTSNVRWETVSKVWANQPFYRAVSPGAAETLFVRHIARLQRAEAQYDRLCAAEVRLSRACGLLPSSAWADSDADDFEVSV